MKRPLSPPAVLVVGFAVLIVIGTVVLWLPVSSSSGDWTPPLTAAFTAASAVCVTGLVVVDTGTYWSPFGQVVILALIQLGGLGFMTGSTLLLFLLVRHRSSLRDRILVQASTAAPNLGSITAVLRRVAVFTVLAEGVGSMVLGAVFLARGEEPLRAMTWGVFHAVSAFNNAGFDLMGDYRSLTEYATDPVVLGIIAGLLILGGLGFAIVGDIAGKRAWHRLALETKVVVLTSAGLLIGGGIVLGLAEWTNLGTLGALPPTDRVVNAFFMSASARTAGFNSIATQHMLEASLVVMIVLMFIGGASGSTAGGIKVNTFTLLLIAIVSSVRGLPSATAFGRRVPHLVVYRALAVALLAVAVAFVVTVGIEAWGEARLVDHAFEAVSALGTVGLTTAFTPALPDPARVLLMVAMFVGRLGPLTLVLALTARDRPVSHRVAIESMRIG